MRYHKNGGVLVKGVPQPLCRQEGWRNLSPLWSMVNCKRCRDLGGLESYYHDLVVERLRLRTAKSSRRRAVR